MADEVSVLAARLNKAFGEGVCVRASDLVISRRFTTGSISIDVAMGGGLPANHWIEVLGPESAGKTAFVLKTIAANQALDPDFQVLWVAAEHYDVDQAVALGVANERVLVVQTQEMETAFTAMLEAAESRSVDCIVLDSYPALLADEEDEKAMTDSVVAVGARLFGKFIRKAGKASRRAYDGSERPMLGIIINQYRDKIGGFAPFGTPKTSPGGKAKNYFFYVRIELARVEWIKEKRPGISEPVIVGQTIKAKMIKNKSAAPQQSAEVRFFFRGAPILGFTRGDYDVADELVNIGTLYRVIRRTSNGHHYWNEWHWTSGKDIREYLRKNSEDRKQLNKEILEVIKDPKILDHMEEK